MDGRIGRASLEDILTEVENDAALAAGSTVQGEAVDAAATVAQDTGEQGMGALGGLLAHPELMAKLPTLLRAVQSLTEPPRGADKPPHTPEALLCALRPYLNEPRRRALDTMIRITRLSESLGSLGG